MNNAQNGAEQNMQWEFLKLLGGASAVSIALIGAAYWLFQKWAGRLLEDKFDKRLASFKHAQQQELDFARFKISQWADRAIKLNQREFEILPTAWSKLFEAFASTSSVNGMQWVTDLHSKSEAELEVFILESDLTESEKIELRASTNRTDWLMRRNAWRRLMAAQNLVRDSHRFIKANSIFLPPEIRDQMLAAEDLMWSALVEQEVNERTGKTGRRSEALLKFLKEGDGAMDRVSQAIQSYLSDFRSANYPADPSNSHQ